MSLAHLLGTVASYVPPTSSGTILVTQLRALAIVGRPQSGVSVSDLRTYAIVGRPPSGVSVADLRAYAIIFP